MLRLTQAVRATAPSGRALVYGFMDPEDLGVLKVDDYQRGALPVQSVEAWTRAFYSGEVPPLDLGSRNKFATSSGTGITIGGDDIFVVDGLQRITTARIIHQSGGSLLIPVMVYLGTTADWETQRFATLNADRRKVGSSVLLRNSRQLNPAVAVMHSYSTAGSGTLLDGKVQWTQSPLVGNLFTGVALLRTMASLHSPFGRGLLENNVPRLAWALSDVTEKISVEALGQNVDAFFGILNRIHNFQSLKKSTNVIYLRLGYMLSLARLFGGYKTFWNDGRLEVTDAVVEAVAKLEFDSFEMRDVSNSGRSIQGLTDRMHKVALGARRGRLVAWN